MPSCCTGRTPADASSAAGSPSRCTRPEAPSPASELQAIETILQAGGEERQASTVKEIAAQTVLPVQTVRRQLRLRSLSPGVRRVFDAGEIPASVAEAAARFPADHQALLERALAAGERLTLAAVRDAARGQAQASGEQLPGALFAERTAAWQTTVRGHLEAAIQALPTAAQDSPLAHALALGGGAMRARVATSRTSRTQAGRRRAHHHRTIGQQMRSRLARLAHPASQIGAY